MPHSDIHGSTPARGSPWLFAACHVLHRLLVPRHPPNALLMLEKFFVRAARHNSLARKNTAHRQQNGRPLPTSVSSGNALPPCTGTIQTSGRSVTAGRLLSTTHGMRTAITSGRHSNACERQRHRSLAARSQKTRLPVRQSRPTTRPQTHQNLIHINKEHTHFWATNEP